MKPATYLTNKKIILSLAVFAGAVFLFSIGFWINNSILNDAEQKARMYQTAIQTKGDDQLNYSIDTKQGRILTTVTIQAVDTVKFDEMTKSFPYVKKTEERYERKTREVCETHYRTVSDGEGGTTEESYETCHDETYYEWDFVQDWEKQANQVSMADGKYPMSMFSLRTHDIDAKEIVAGATGKYVRKEAEKGLFDINFFDSDDVGDIRYSYEVMDLPQSGTVFLNVTEGVQAVSGGKINLETTSPAETIKKAQDSAQTQSTVFWVLWGLLVIVELGVGVYYVWFYEEY